MLEQGKGIVFLHHALASYREWAEYESITGGRFYLDLKPDVENKEEYPVSTYDTAANYGCGHSERVLGQALAGRRDQVVLATKFGYLVDEEAKTVRYYDDDIDSDKVVENLRRECEDSLRRLNTDYIDL
jgi:predicted oxidoreductase